ncbi:hypothetical protein K505DRAFT_202625, partial [Melanomma pulvis-pyrius CBS 109.77]
VAWSAPKPDDTIPTTDADMQALVKNLVLAIANNQDCLCSSTNRIFRNRWAAGANFYRPEQFEKLAWRIVNTMVTIHTEGWKHPVYDSGLMASLKATTSYTFAGRMEKILNLLTFSKRTCEDMLKNEKLLTIIGAPQVVLTHSRLNFQANKVKKRRINRGREAEKAEEE